MKTKIAYVIPTLSLGGAEKQQVNILNGMIDDRFEIKLFVLKNKTQLLPQLKNEKIDVEICHIESMIDIGAFFRFIKSIKSFNPDIIHAHMYNANILVRFLKIVLPQCKIINHYHGMSQWMSKPKLYLDKATSFLVDKFIVVSQKSFDLRLQREGYPVEKMLLLFNSVDLKPLHETNMKLRDRKQIVIGMASRLIPLKNIAGAIFMTAELMKKGFDPRLVVAGDGPEKENLIKYSEKLGVHDKVEFFGFVEQMEEFYKKIDIYCISSKTEDLPLSIVEAMMAGKPVIASNVGGIPDILKDAACTMLVDDFYDTHEIEKISSFIKSLEYEKCKKELTQYASRNFSNSDYCKKLHNIYMDLMH